MGFVISTINGIKKIYRNIKIARNTAENRLSVLQLTKEKIISYMKILIKGLLYQFLTYGVIIVVLISAVGVVFQSFITHFGGDPYDVDPRAMKEWADSLTDRDIKLMQEMGTSIHPRKLPIYAEIEDNSYKKNVEIKIPVEVETIIDGSSSGISTSYEDYLYTRGDTAYPYRQWWQSVAGLDAVNDTANKEKDVKLTKNAEMELAPIYSWSDPMSLKYNHGDIYGKTSKHEKIKTNIVNTETLNYKNGELTSRREVEVITKKFYPLPFLEEVITMFAKYNFKFDKIYTTDFSISSTSHSWTETTYTTRTVRKKDIVDGKEVIVEEEIEEEEVDEYTTEIIIKYTNILDSWGVLHPTKEFVTRFFDFLVTNNIDTKSDPEVMYYMAEHLPQNYDFLMEYGEYLEYASLTNVSGFKGGFSGTFSNFNMGDYEITPSDLIRDVPLFIQTDKRWADFPYSYTGSSLHGTIGTSGCGPTSMAMAIVGLGGYNQEIDLNKDGLIDPYEATKYALKGGHRIYGSGTSWAYFNDIGGQVGVKVKQVVPRSFREVIEALKQGHPVIASMGPGSFTKEGHYITLIGIDKNGRIIVNDSNSVSRSGVSWSFERTILPQAKQFWIISK